MLQRLADLLGGPPPGADPDEEEELLEEAVLSFAGIYEFIQEGGVSHDIFHGLLDNRFLLPGFVSIEPHCASSPRHVFCAVQCMRLFLRDNGFRRIFVDKGGLAVLAALMRRLAEDHYRSDPVEYGSEILTEAASIVKKIATHSPEYHRRLMEAELHITLVMLLATSDADVLPSVLVALISLAQRKHQADAIGDTYCFEALLHIIEGYGSLYMELAADLLSVLAKKPDFRLAIVETDGLHCILSQISAAGAAGLQPLLRLLCHMLTDEVISEVRDSGGIPVLVSLLGEVKFDVSVKTQSTNFRGMTVDTISLLCSCLSRLAQDDDASYQIRQCNGIYLLGSLLLAVDGPGRGGEAGGPNITDAAEKKVAVVHIFRSLRYIFSSERNRKVFKRLFTPDFFTAFIDTGSYEIALGPYEKLATHWGTLGEPALQKTREALEDINLYGAQRNRCVKGYTFLDIMGKGAFGSVYKAKKDKSGAVLAVKELSLDVVSTFGATTEERQKTKTKVMSEVEILSKVGSDLTGRSRRRPAPRDPGP